ncbi:hypothetical protein F5Y18DRAFT_277418 [Xylariaceae sp. FL1019]|nr:hypothetical protein F5Y18DRAFT_277418 [Xylariaceae sp. FL1019]
MGAIAAFLNWGPLWLTLYLLASTFATDYHYAYSTLIFPHEDVSQFGIPTSTRASAAGIVIITISSVLKMMFLGSWGYALWLTWFSAPRWSPSIHRLSPAIGQASSQVFAHVLEFGVLPETVRLSWHEGEPFWKCPIPECSNGREGTTDRCYHSKRLNRCLPCYNHYCPWIKVAVYLHTLKPYMSLQIWLVLDIVFSIAVSIKSLVDSPVYVALHVAFLLGGIMIAILAVNTLQQQFLTQILRNELAFEKGSRVNPRVMFNTRLVAFKVAKRRDEFDIRLKHFPDRSPWDYGFLENCYHTLGPFWQWPLFWIQPDRVRYYRKHGRFQFNKDIDRYHSSLT